MKRTAAICLFLGAFGCAVSPTEDPSQDELQALLRDEPLSNIGSTSSGLSFRVGPDSSIPPGRGDASNSPDAGADDDGGALPSGDGGAIPPPPAGDGGTSPSFDGGGGGRGDGGSPFTPDAGPFGDGGPLPGDAGTSTNGSSGFPLGVWSFDDCNEFRTNLFDSSFNQNTAFRSVSVACGAGVGGQAVALAIPSEDIVTVPDQPNFVFDAGVTVAGWFNAASRNQTSSLFRKRHDDTSAFALLIHQGRYKFVVNLGRNRAAAVTSRQRVVTGQWAHVAGTYDGEWLRLYVDGVEVDQQRAPGLIRGTSGPVVMGNDGSQRILRGSIDNAFLEARALAPSEISNLLCVRGNPTLSASPAVSAPTQPGMPAIYDVTVTSGDTPECSTSNVVVNVSAPIGGITVDPPFSFIDVPAGGSSQLSVSVTATDDVEPGSYTVPIDAFGLSSGGAARTSVEFVLAASGCRVSTRRELMITDLSVVDDPARTNGNGAWTFRHLMESMAPTPADAPAMVEGMLNTFLVPTTVNSFVAAPRPGFQFILDSWPRSPNGQLDLSQAPLALQAIVNRFDLRDPARGDAGEGRFVFAFIDPNSRFPLQATLIIEYKLPAANTAEVLGWAQSWHALGALPFPSEEYNAALEAVTERFAGRNARPGATNGSAVNTVRTNEIDLGDNRRWELREFRLSAATGVLAPVPVDRTPDLSFNETQTLADFISANEPDILSETHVVPNEFAGAPFAAAATFNDLVPWSAPGVSSDARFRFSTNTCGGCHSQETNTFFLQISPRFPGSEAFLSPFLTGTTAFDAFTGQPRTLNELARRAAGMRAVVCP